MANTEQLHMNLEDVGNPFKPGAGHMPPYLAGRNPEQEEFRELLKQTTILKNVVLTGLRGVGKTVLLETFKPIAQKSGWLWVGADMSEAVSVNEERLAIRLLADLSVVTSTLVIHADEQTRIGFAAGTEWFIQTLDFAALEAMYRSTPGLVEDKLKNVLELAWKFICDNDQSSRGIIFAYDEAQNLSDNRQRDEFPLSILLDVFQSLQKKNIPFMLVLTGLPTLIPKLVEARTYSERMFQVIHLSKLGEDDSREAITVPIEKSNSPVSFHPESVEAIIYESAGYPYFLQFICREVYDVFLRDIRAARPPSAVPVVSITQKLDQDFFAGRWGNCSDRQRELLWVFAQALDRSGGEVTIQDIVATSKRLLKKGFSPSHANQILVALNDKGLVYKNRHGRYSLAVPLLDRFILRQDFEEAQRE
ncbi:MAG: ATP-binding protein [Actinomycetota bacterium]|nr:ATP-binding protein [Actinomycetota bacterium]